MNIITTIEPTVITNRRTIDTESCNVVMVKMLNMMLMVVVSGWLNEDEVDLKCDMVSWDRGDGEGAVCVVLVVVRKVD